MVWVIKVTRGNYRVTRLQNHDEILGAKVSLGDISEAIMNQKLIPFLDNYYRGFTTNSLQRKDNQNTF